MATQEENRVPGGGSPFGPDSTWEEASKMEARFAALEQRLLKDQEEKHAALVDLLAKLQHPEQAGELGKLRRIVEERLIPGLEKVEGGQQGSQDAVQKLDLLMRGENEANKLIDGIVPGVEKVFRMVEKLDKKFEKETEKLKKEISYVYENTRNTERIVGDIMDVGKKNKRMLEKLEERGEKRRSMTSRRRRTKSGDSDSSRSGSRRRSRSNSSKRRGAISATPSKKEQEVAGMLEQINGSLGLQREMLEKQNAKTVVEQEVVPSLERLTKMVEMQGARLKLVEAKEAAARDPMASKWDRGSGDDTPSPPRTTSNVRTGEASAAGESFSDRRPRDKKKKMEKKKRRARSGSSSSSSSSEERGVKDRDKYKDMMDIMVTAVKSVEEKVKELSKSTKRSQQKVESDCKFVMDRVGEMTMGVQVIAENLDSVNDVAKKIEVLDSIQTGLAKLGNLETLVSKVQESANNVTSDLPLVPTTKQSSLSLTPGHLPITPSTLPLAPPPLRPPPMMDWDDRDDRTMSNVNLDNLVHEVVNKVDRKLCEFGSMVEGNMDRLERELKMDESQPPWSKIKALTEITKALSGNSLKVLELVRKIEKRGEGEVGLPASNDRLTELGDRVGEVLPKLDDIYIRVLPALEDIKQRARKESERENLTLKELREQAEKVEKIMDMVEDLKEGGMGKGGVQSMESGIKASLAEEGVISLLEKIEEDLLFQQGLVKQNTNALADMRTFTAKQTSLDKIERLIKSEYRGDEDGEGQGKVDRHLGRILDFLKKEEKTLDMLMKNSMSDAKALSSCNTSIQGMKVAVSGNGKEVVAAVQQVAESVKAVEESLKQVCQDVGGLGGSLDEIGSQVRALEKEGGVCSGLEGIAKLQSSVERMSSKVSAIAGGGVVVQSGKKEAGKEVLVKEVADLQTDSRLEVIHELLVQSGEKFESFNLAIAGVDSDLKKHDKNIGHAVRTLVGLLKASVDNTKKNSSDLERLDKLVKKEISSVVDKINLSSEDLKNAISEVIAESGDREKDKANLEVVTKMDTVGSKLETVVSKMDKLNKTVSRIKSLVEAEDSDEEGEGGRRSKKRKGEAPKSDPYEFSGTQPTIDLKPLEKRLEEMSAKLARDLGDKKGDDIGAKLQSLENSIVRRLEEELERSSKVANETSLTINKVDNVVKEIGDRMVTKRSWDSLQDKLIEIRENLARVPDDFGRQAAALEENLCVNVQGSVREVINHAMEEMMTEMDGVNGKLGYIKRYVRFGGKEVDDIGEGEPGSASLDNLMEQITGVASRLAGMQSALELEATDSQEENSGGARVGARERLGTALLLTEIRKKADSESVQKMSQEMYKAIHNVQRRLLEEQNRLVSRFGGGRGESPPPAFMGIVEALNKVRECQVTIQSNQDLAISLQTTTNRLLGNAVEHLEETAQFAADGGNGDDLEAGRLSTLCDALADTLTNLMSAQDKMGRRDGEHVEALDRLVRSTTSMVAAQETTRSPRSHAGGQEARVTPGRKRGADLLARGETSPPPSTLVKKGRRGGESRRSPATEEEEEDEEVEMKVKEEEDREMGAGSRVGRESQERSQGLLPLQQTSAKVRQPSVRVERQSLSASQKQQLAKESVVQPQLNLQDEFASPEKALDEEEQRR